MNLEYLVCRWSISISVAIKGILCDKNRIYTNSICTNSSNTQILIAGSIAETDRKIELNTAFEGYIECLILPNCGTDKTFLL